MGISYPLEAEPGCGDGSHVQVVPGLHWLRMPLGGSLRWINVWALAEPGGVTIVDTGILSDATKSAWEQALPSLLGSGTVHRVLITHMHPDHCGVAGWLCSRFGAELWMSRLEYLTCRVLISEHGQSAPESSIEFYRRSGWPAEAIERFRSRYGYFGTLVLPLPASFHRLGEGKELRIGGESWRVVVGTGHSPEHACLYCEQRRLLISGDQVLPRISSNVSVYPSEPDADPLRDWLGSLRRLRELPPDVLVLPAHNNPFLGLHTRIDELAAHHELSLSRLLDVLTEPRTAMECFPVLFSRAIPPDLLMMATGEALAHLNHLYHAGCIDRELNARGVWLWRRK